MKTSIICFILALLTSCSRRHPSDHYYVELVGVPESVNKVLFFAVEGNNATVLDWYVPDALGYDVLAPWDFDGKTEVDSNDYSLKFQSDGQELGVLMMEGEIWRYAVLAYDQKGNNHLVVRLESAELKLLDQKAVDKLKDKQKIFFLPAP